MSDAQRKAFEVWQRDLCKIYLDLDRTPNGDYTQYSTQWQWQSWQAATAHILALLDRPEVAEAAAKVYRKNRKYRLAAEDEDAADVRAMKATLTALKEEISK